MTIKMLCLVAGTLVALGHEPARGQLVRARACRGDVEKFCQGIAPGGGRLIRCLEENSAKLSAGCKKVIGAGGAEAGGAEASGGGPPGPKGRRRGGRRPPPRGGGGAGRREDGAPRAAGARPPRPRDG